MIKKTVEHEKNLFPHVSDNDICRFMPDENQNGSL